ncbi:MAG: hypothetical protein Q9210_000214 [Variospora velana]
MITGQTARSPSPPPQPPVAQTPGPRAAQFQKLFGDALNHTLRTCSYSKFSACFPTPAKLAPQTLTSIWQQITSKVEASAKKEFEDILLERDVVASLNELERLVGEARSRKERGVEAGDPPHTLPPERLYLAHLAPYLQQTQSELEGELKRLQSENEELVEGIQGQREEAEHLVGGLEAFIADLERANGIMGSEVDGNGVKKEVVEVEQDLRAAGREAKFNAYVELYVWRFKDPTVTNEGHPPLPPLAVTRDQPGENSIIPTEQLYEQPESVSDTQSSSYDGPIYPAESCGARLAPDDPSASTSTRRVITICSFPQTPSSRDRTVQTLIPRHIRRTIFLSLNQNDDQSRHVAIRARAPSPPDKRSSEPFDEPLPRPTGLETPSTPCSSPPSLNSLPLEIKQMVYRELLVSSANIKKPHRLVCNKRSIMLDSVQPVKDIDSRILRVCRSIYAEALPILYGQNIFEFAKPRKLRDFSHGYLDKRNPRFAFREADAGRFTLIRCIILRLGYDRKPYAFQRPPGAAPVVPDRKRIWSHWHQYFFNDNDSRNQYDWGWFPTLGNEFPALDRCELDFTAWQLGEGDAIRVDPIVSKLRKSGGLSIVLIRGLKNPTNLQQLKQGLVKPGGKFFTMD